MSKVVYEASVYTSKVSYTNFKGQTKEVELFFALDPIQLLRVIAGVPTPKSKSNNPAKKAEPELSEEQQLKFLVDLASRAAGFPSDDGESFEPFPEFDESLAGKAFITKLASSDTDRMAFSKQVVVDPFEAFIAFAKADPTNDAGEVQQFDEMLATIKRLFAPPSKDETVDDRKARLVREMAELDKLVADA